MALSQRIIISEEKMACSIELGQNGRTKLYGYDTSNNYELFWTLHDYNNERGQAHCELCRTDGTFEGVFYGLCAQCSENAGPCQCVYCRVAGVDGHKLVERRQNICKFIKTIQSAIDDLKRDYPTDEYGIVKEGIESGFYILDLHTKHQYAKFLDEARTPEEVNQLTIGELLWRWQPERPVPEAVIYPAIVAAKRSGIWDWVQKMWRESCIDIERIRKQTLTCAECKCVRCGQVNEMDNIGYCLECQNEPFKCLACNEVVALKTVQKGHCWDCQYVYCTECNTMDHILNMDDRGYCAICQNPDNDQGWPKGD